MNIAAAVVLAAGIFTAVTMFRSREASRSEGRQLFTTAEGVLIQELKRETDSLLREKDQEIAGIQERLVSVRKERDDLNATMEDRISRQEQELRKALEEELAAERARLLAAGVAQDRIVELLSTMKDSRLTEIARELQVYRSSLEAEQLRLEADLTRLQQDFERQLSDLNRQRADLVRNSRLKEEELRKQFEEREGVLASREAEARQRVDEAEATMAELRSRQEKRSLVENQIVGSYASLERRFGAGDYSGALSALDELEAFLRSPAAGNTEELRERIPADLFFVRTLRTLITEETAPESSSMLESVETAAKIEQIRSLTEDGKRLEAAGDNAAAAQAYLSALRLIPDVSAGFEAISSLRQRDRERLAQEQRDRFDELLRRGDEALARKDYEAALGRYREAAAQLSVAEGSSERFLEGIRQAGSGIENARLVPLYEARIEQLSASLRAASAASETAALRDDRTAAALLDEADRLTAAERFGGAIPAYLSVIERYPSSIQAPLAASRAKEAAAALDRDLRQRIDELRGRLETVSGEYRSYRQDTEQRLAGLQTQADADLSGQLAGMSAEYRTYRQNSEKQLADLRAQVAALSPLSAPADQYRQLTERYAEYAKQETALLSGADPAALIPAKQLLDDFLASAPVRTAMPGFLDRVRTYDRAFERAGREEAVSGILDLISSLSGYSDRQERLDFIRSEQERAGQDAYMRDLLGELEYLLAE